jgi:hypothetical protein
MCSSRPDVIALVVQAVGAPWWLWLMRRRLDIIQRAAELGYLKCGKPVTSLEVTGTVPGSCTACGDLCLRCVVQMSMEVWTSRR